MGKCECVYYFQAYNFISESNYIKIKIYFVAARVENIFEMEPATTRQNFNLISDVY